MKLSAHPLHRLFLHFPAALLPMDLCCSFLAIWTAKDHFLYAGYYALVGGVLVGWLAMITGTLDLLKWKAVKVEGRKHVIGMGIMHGSLQAMVVMGYSFLTFSEWRNYPYLEVNSTGELVAKGILVGLLFVGNYLGAELILKFEHHDFKRRAFDLFKLKKDASH